MTLKRSQMPPRTKPMSRGKPMARTALESSTTAWKPPKDTGPDAKTKLAVYKTFGWMCACCGTSLIDMPHSIGHRMRRAQGGSNAFPNLLPFLGLGNGLMGDDLDHHHRIDSRIDPHDHAAGWQLDRCQDPARESFLLVSEYGSGQQTWILGSGDLAFENPYEVEAA